MHGSTLQAKGAQFALSTALTRIVVVIEELKISVPQNAHLSTDSGLVYKLTHVC